jgi:hypothetical protein
VDPTSSRARAATTVGTRRDRIGAVTALAAAVALAAGCAPRGDLVPAGRVTVHVVDETVASLVDAGFVDTVGRRDVGGPRSCEWPHHDDTMEARMAVELAMGPGVSPGEVAEVVETTWDRLRLTVHDRYDPQVPHRRLRAGSLDDGLLRITVALPDERREGVLVEASTTCWRQEPQDAAVLRTWDDEWRDAVDPGWRERPAATGGPPEEET